MNPPVAAEGGGRRRVLEVLFSFRVGGSEVVGLELARQMAAAGDEVLCTALDGLEGPLRERCAQYGLQVVDIGLPLSGPLGRNGVSARLVRALRALRLDAIHLQHFLGLNKLGLAARLAGIPRIVVTEHSEAGLKESLPGRMRLRANWRLAHETTVIHEGIKQYLVDEIGMRATRISVIPNGIDLDYWHRNDRAAQRARLGLGDETAFMFAGRLAAVKNIPRLVAVFLDAVAAMPVAARLLICGDGEQRAQCAALIAAHPSGRQVELLGETSDVRAQLAAADVFVMNSLSEGTPRAMMEAMAMGLPGISTAVGGIPPMLENCGLLVRPGDEATLRAALITAATDPGRMRALGTAAQSRVRERWDARKMVAEYRRALAR